MTRDDALAYWKACCAGKRAYDWLVTAESEAQHLNRQQGTNQAGYICPFCHRCHVGRPVTTDRLGFIIEAALLLSSTPNP